MTDQVWKHSFDQVKEGPHRAVGHQVEQVLHENNDPAKRMGLALVVVFDHLNPSIQFSDSFNGFLR